MLQEMKVGWIVFLCIVFTGSLPASVLHCDSPIKDFGEINEGQKLSHSFTVRNITRRSIRVTRVVASCGCITSLDKQFELEAGEQVEVPIEFNSMGYGGKTIEKPILLLVGDETTPALILTIKGRIKGIPPEERITVIPSEKSIFNTVDEATEIKIRGPANRNIEISVKGPDWLNVKMSKPQKLGVLPINEWKLKCSLNRAFSNRVKGTLAITTNLPRFEELSVPIYVELQPQVRVNPPVLFITVNGQEKTYTREFSISLLSSAEKKDSTRKEEMSNELETMGRNQPMASGSVSAAVSESRVHVEPSNNCMKVEPVRESSESGARRYKVEVKNCDSVGLNLRIMINDFCIRKVPVIISGLSADKGKAGKQSGE